MFETIYRWFISLFGTNLAEHLSGWDEAAGDYSKTNLFTIIGIITLSVAIVVCVIYYYVLNHPRQNRWWKWLLFWLLPVAVFGFIVAFATTVSDVLSDNVSSNIADIRGLDCLGFGFANLIIASLFFIICSVIIKWWSSNCKNSPF